jgi:hypothetical protein
MRLSSESRYAGFQKTIVPLARAIIGLWTEREIHALRGAFCCQNSGRFSFQTGLLVQLSGFRRAAPDGPSHAGKSAMTKIAYSESQSGHVVRTAIVPANRSEEAKFGPLDRTVIIAILLCFLLCVAGLIYPLMH